MNEKDIDAFTVHFTDQFKAASMEAAETTKTVAEEYKKEKGTLHERDIKFFDTYFGKSYKYITTAEGYLKRAKMCNHIDRLKPQVMFSNVKDAFKIYCKECFMIQELQGLTKYSDRCDGCLSTGIKAFYSFQVQAGPLLVSGHLCEDCEKKQTETM